MTRAQPSTTTHTVRPTSSAIQQHAHIACSGDNSLGDTTSTGWPLWFSQSGFNNKQFGQSGTGDTAHITADPAANLTFQFYGMVFWTCCLTYSPTPTFDPGKAISLYGNSNCSYQVEVDGVSEPFNATNGTLFQKNDLSETFIHEIVVTPQATNESRFAFDHAAITRSHLPQDR